MQGSRSYEEAFKVLFGHVQVVEMIDEPRDGVSQGSAPSLEVEQKPTINHGFPGQTGTTTRLDTQATAPEDAGLLTLFSKGRFMGTTR